MKAKTSPEFDRFTALVDKVLSVPKAVVQKRLEEYEEQAKQNPKRRGPKRKVSQNDHDPKP